MMRTLNVYYYHVNRREAHKYLVNRNQQLKLLKHQGVDVRSLQFYQDYCGFLDVDGQHTKPFSWVLNYPMI